MNVRFGFMSATLAVAAGLGWAGRSIAGERLANGSAGRTADAFGLNSAVVRQSAKPIVRVPASVEAAGEATALLGQQKSACFPCRPCRPYGSGVAWGGGLLTQPCVPACYPRSRCAPFYPNLGTGGVYPGWPGTGYGVPACPPAWCPPARFSAPAYSLPGYVQPGLGWPILGQSEPAFERAIVPAGSFGVSGRGAGFDSPFFP